MPNIQSIHGHRGSDEAHKKALDKRWHVPLHVGFVETVSSLLILIFSSCEHAWEKNTCTRMVNAMINTFNSPLRPRQNVVSSDRQVNAMLLCSLMLQSTTDSHNVNCHVHYTQFLSIWPWGPPKQWRRHYGPVHPSPRHLGAHHSHRGTALSQGFCSLTCMVQSAAG
jgi:hypothetical protein